MKIVSLHWFRFGGARVTICSIVQFTFIETFQKIALPPLGTHNRPYTVLLQYVLHQTPANKRKLLLARGSPQNLASWTLAWLSSHFRHEWSIIS